METFIEFLKAIVFGIVEGITEWLPVSSTGHMIILENFFSLGTTQGKDFFNLFLVLIQLGAIIAVILSFFRQLWPFGKKKSRAEKKGIWYTWLKILISSVPAGILGLLFDDWLDEHLYNYITVSLTLIIYGVFFILVEMLLKRRSKHMMQRFHLTEGDMSEHGTYSIFRKRKIVDLTISDAMIIGLAQALALIPGTSRSGVTILAALLLSINRETSAKYSFFLSIPAMLGGSLIKAVQFGIKVHQGKTAALTGLQFALIIVAMIVAFVVSFFVIRFFMKLLRTRTFIGFGIYRIVLGVVLVIVFLTTGKGRVDNSSVAALMPLSGNLDFAYLSLYNSFAL